MAQRYGSQKVMCILVLCLLILGEPAGTTGGPRTGPEASISTREKSSLMKAKVRALTPKHGGSGMVPDLFQGLYRSATCIRIESF